MHISAAIFCAVIGLIAGIVGQVPVRRLPTHQSISSTRHHCDNCGVVSKRIQRISVLARVVKARMCVNCGAQLWPKFPGLELFCVALLAIVGLSIGWSWTLPAYIVFFTTLVYVTVIDMRHYMIPTKLIYRSLFATMLLFAIAAIIRNTGGHMVDALIGMAVAWLFFAIIWFIYPAGMGFGDVRLSALIGLASGYVSLANVGLSILLALLIGAAVGVVLIVISLRNRKQAIPFGPFLAAGATLSILGGDLLN